MEAVRRNVGCTARDGRLAINVDGGLQSNLWPDVAVHRRMRACCHGGRCSRTKRRSKAFCSSRAEQSGGICSSRLMTKWSKWGCLPKQPGNFSPVIFASSLRVAAISGRDFDDTLRSIALRISSLALNKAFQPLDDLFGSLISSVGQSILSGSPASASPVAPQSRSASIVFNVQTPDAAGFRKSESQISSMLARAVARGSRGL